MTTRQRYNNIQAWFEVNNPMPEPELHFDNAWQCLMAVMLSAQCTDKRVNMVTPALFAAYPTPKKMYSASLDDVLKYVHSVSYPNAKAMHLIETAKRLVDVYGGAVPNSIDELTTLPGVGRKTANVVCAVIWNQPTMAVDTHIFRVAERLGLTTNSKSPLHTERALVKLVPPELIPKAHHWFLLHGRYVCVARKPKCKNCGLKEWCRYYQKKSSNPCIIQKKALPLRRN